ncbi:MAG: acyl-CoA thioesterase [Flavobacteriales bacterium]|nr:acyl-CoA thioesterase [Flavobacteriales bacterium]
MIESTAERAITFGDLDPMGIVWHGNYIRFMELGREAFGRAHGLDSIRMYDQGYYTPIVRATIDHKAMLSYGDTVVVRAWIKPSPAAKIIFQYELTRKSDHVVVATAETVQVFLDRDRKLLLDAPDFYRAWQEEHQLVAR